MVIAYWDQMALEVHSIRHAGILLKMMWLLLFGISLFMVFCLIISNLVIFLLFQRQIILKLFRPIAKADFHLKLITKILSGRLAPIASKIISPQQAAFIKGRNISDNIITTFECINVLDQKS